MNLPDIFDAILEFGGDVAVGGAKQAGRALIAGYLKRKAEAARDILLEEIRSGDKLPPQVASDDDAVAVIYRYLRSANEGAARINLRLLAKAIVGKMRTTALLADEFNLYADALASLSRDEIIVIATIWKQHAAPRPFRPTISGPVATPWHATVLNLQDDGWPGGRVVAAANRAQRSGLIIASAQSGFNGGGGLLFSPSAMLEELVKTVDFDDALRAEPE